MKKLFTVLALLFSACLFAQTDYTKIPLKTKEDCKAAEPDVLSASKLIISKPLGDASVNKAMIFLITWMSNCEYSFTIDEKITKLTKKKANKDLLGVYMACMAKAVLENPDIAKDNEAIEIAAFSTLADYCSDSAHNVSVTKDIQKLIDAKKNGTMKDYVKAKS